MSTWIAQTGICFRRQYRPKGTLPPLGESKPRFGRSGPELAEPGPDQIEIRLDSGLELAEVGPTSVDIGPKFLDSAEIRPIPGTSWPTSVECAPKSARILSASGQLQATPAEIWPKMAMVSQS